MLWQFEGGEPESCPLTALENASGETLVLPVEQDCKKALQLFACQCILEVLDRWDTPGIVHQYLKTGEGSIQTIVQSAQRITLKEIEEPAARDAALHAARAKQALDLITLLAELLVPVPNDLRERFEEERRIRYEHPQLHPLYLGQWWAKELPGLEYIEQL